METSRNIQVIGPPVQQFQPQHNTESSAHGISYQKGGFKTFTVDRALQYTPLVTSVIPAHDRIPLPQVCRAKESARLTTSAERKSVQQCLTQYPTKRVKERLQGLLKPDLLPEYKFKQLPHSVSTPQADLKVGEQPNLTLSSTAKMIFDSTAIDYKCLVQRQSITTGQVTTKPKKVPPLQTLNMAKSIPKNSRKDDRTLPGPNGQMSSITKPAARPISINLPKPQLEAKLERYETNTGSPKRRKLSHGEAAVQISLHSRSQKDIAEAAMQQFQNALLEVFEAQDQLDAGSSAVYEAGFFEQVDGGDDSEPHMTTKTMENLLIGLKKLVNMQKLSDVSSEHLRRLQLLCEPLIDKVQTIDLHLRADADQDDQDRWRTNILKAELGLLSATLLLHTILTPFPNESLLSTEAIGWIPSALRNIFENCLIPVIESRPDEASSESFTVFTTHTDALKKLLGMSRKVLDVVSTACSQTRGLENVVNPIEFLASKLIFVQNATIEKQSVLGIQTFEKARKTAMSSLARIFARFPAERSAILDEILTSLDKLPSTSRSARQYRIGDGKSIQLISALFMQLVQNTALETPESQSRARKGNTGRIVGNMDDEDADDGARDATQLVEDQTANETADVYTRLQEKGNKLFDGAARSAQEIVAYLVGRASKTTKSGDSPYRNILDLFIEDMITVLSLPDWPSSELMLRIMAAKMIEMAQSEKTASAKNMALESLGSMGSAISTLKASLSKQCSSMSREGKPKSPVAEHLIKLSSDQEQGSVRNEDMISFSGPFAVVSKHLWTGIDHGLRNLSACGFFLAQYAKVMALMVNPSSFDEFDIEAGAVRVADFLLDCISQIGSGSTTLQNFDTVSLEEAELAYTLSVLNMGFCRRFGVIVKTLSSSFSSGHALVRTRSLKSVATMLETDPTILDHDPSIADDVFTCASDDSGAVRDSALALIARFIIAKPRLEQKGIQRLLECASDPKVGVQKKAIGHLKDIYMKDNRVLLKATISRVILKRTSDHESIISELAKKSLSEIWITPVYAQFVHSEDLAKTKVAIQELTGDIVSCVSYDAVNLCPLLKRFIKTMLFAAAKPESKVRDLCAKIVDVLFENTISGQDEKGPLMVLTSFAEAEPELIPPAHLGKLQPYLGNLKTEGDLFVFKAVISIYGFVLPHLSATHKPLLLDIQNALMKAISSLGRRAELDTVMSCLQVIDSVVQNTMRLIKLAGSIVVKIKAGAANLAQSQDGVPQLLKLLRIAGSMARYIDLEKYWRQFAEEVKEQKELKIRSVAAYIASTFLPLTTAKQPLRVRLLALESLGSVCQAFPGQLNQRSIQQAFFSVFTADASAGGTAERDSLQGTVLKVFDELYAQRAHSKEDDDNDDDQEEKQELGKLGGDSKTRDGDSAISMVTGIVVKSALAVALSSPNDNALIATRTLSSISHQGLTHPKQSLLAFVALSTCPDTRIADVAHDAHRLLHQQHESVCEREYMTAVHEAFEYQRNVLSDSCGARLPHHKAKLSSCFEVVNTSGSKYVKKFLSGLVSRVSAKITVQESSLPADQVLWTLFAVQNLAFFEFTKLDEVLHAILQLELAYSKKGVEISQMLEAALISNITPDDPGEILMENSDQAMHDVTPLRTVKDIETIRRLAPLAGTLTIMMEGRSYLKRQYGVGRDVRAAISNTKQAKDTGKAPTKVYGITGDKFWTKSNAVIELLHNDSGMITCCQNFVNLMRTDDEINVEDEDPLRDPSASVGPTELQNYIRSGTPGGVKRKLSVSASGTPAKRGRPSKHSRRSTSISSADDPDADFTG